MECSQGGGTEKERDGLIRDGLIRPQVRWEEMTAVMIYLCQKQGLTGDFVQEKKSSVKNKNYYTGGFS